ncbi:hypothetical protein SteCoe_36936 [Stentor coeruleus]|uniref:DDE-1 domain-containing protein n=1 Tax=Stentor coeruleus TaxID=5963 RepID=A0A1R2AP73_9CILI|nr:hypothetical protein SteCoe_36936 [Stentor coeruleus]
MFFPLNTTSVLQSCDQEIISSFKINYRKLLARSILCEMNAPNVIASELENKINVYDAIIMIKRAWNSVTLNTIQGSFKKSGFLITKNSDEIASNDQELHDIALEATIKFKM